MVQEIYRINENSEVSAQISMSSISLQVSVPQLEIGSNGFAIILPFLREIHGRSRSSGNNKVNEEFKVRHVVCAFTALRGPGKLLGPCNQSEGKVGSESKPL